MSPKELNARLQEKCEAALRYLYKDSGTFKAGRFSIGNAFGDEGDSLYVYLKDGGFKDSATGDRGDLLELFSLKMGSKKAGIDAAYGFLGIAKPMKDLNLSKPKKVTQWKKPEKDWTQLTENPSVLEYLTKKRKIPATILEAAGVRAQDDEYYVFISYTHDNPPVRCGANYIGITRKKNKKTGKIKKVVRQQEGPLATLFGHASCPTDKDFVLITEGQIDCLSFRTQGISNTVSIPFGTSATDWIENSWDWMRENFKEVYLCFDNDEPGQAALEKVAKQIGYDRCRKVLIPSQYVDANEAHLDGYDLHKCIDSAIEFKPARLVSTLEIADEALARVKQGRRELQGIPFMGWREPDNEINLRLRPKEWTIYTGHPGDGKSALLYQLIAQLIFVEKQKVVIASLEEDAEEILNLIVCYALATVYIVGDKSIHAAWIECYRYLDQKLFFYHHRNRAPFKDVLETAEYTIRKHGAQHFVLDSVAKTDVNLEDNEEAVEFVNSITMSTNETMAHYHIVAHGRKKKNDAKGYDNIPDLDTVKGSGQFGIECFNCITVWRNRGKAVLLEQAKKHASKGGYRPPYGSGEKVHTVESLFDKEDSLLIINKQKVGGHMAQYKLWFDTECYRFCRNPHLTEEPYAKEIYEHYITNEGREVEEVEEADF